MGTPTASPQVRVGVGVFILKSPSLDPANPTILLGKRKGSHGAGTYALPGGHIEFGETLEECGAREVLEETGLKVKNLEFLTATNDIMHAEGKHYITMFMACTREDEGVEAEVLEPEKCEGWEWWRWEELVRLVERQNEPTEAVRLFLPLINLVEQRAGVIPNVR